ncbi:MAG: RsmB/NOP family class I SAM-dependent RNA methyltransferase, partial [Bacillota bacterium]|nr:RsmB/NOP family class I SAM-dependent RNA methyltransferase [Bacillota bacterium]
MASIKQARERLPSAFISRLQEVFPAPLVDQILDGLSRDRRPTLRINTLKADGRAVMRALAQAGIKFERVLWYPEALVIKEKKEKDLEALPLYQEGQIYLQSLSSMLPPLFLQPRPGEKVLDLAAAPGSKTTQLAALMKNRGFILANDSNPIRLERLRFNLRRQGVEIAQVRCGDGTTLGREYPAFFDKVLLDAPCSGEGLFLVGQPRTWRHWTVKLVARMAARQKKLLASGLRALRPGGTLVYSTCTLSPEENEEVVAWALTQFPGELEVLEPPLCPPGSLPGLTALPERELPPSLCRTRRILPSSTMEGFFLAVLRRVPGSAQNPLPAPEGP